MNNKNRYGYLLNAIKEHGDSDLCLLWPYATISSGYGVVNIGGGQDTVHRLALEYKLGRNILPGLIACHTHSGNRNCFNGIHIYEGTYADNGFDKIKDGTHKPGEQHNMHKLTDEKVLKLREKYATGFYTLRDLAEEFGVCNPTICRIVQRKTWKHLPKKKTNS